MAAPVELACQRKRVVRLVALPELLAGPDNRGEELQNLLPSEPPPIPLSADLTRLNQALFEKIA